MWSEHDDEHEHHERINEREEATEHDKSQLVRFAHNLMMYGFNLSPEETLAIAHVLRVFDPRPPVEEEEDIKF